MSNDTISNLLTSIRNGCLIKSQTVSLPFTRVSLSIISVLEKEGFLQSYQNLNSNRILVSINSYGSNKETSLTNLCQISKPGLRIYVKKKDIPYFLDGMGVFLLSTSKGILTDSEARSLGLGGELLCSIW